jgi:ribonuclease HI
MLYKFLNFLQKFNTYDKTQPVHIFCDASGKYGYAAVVVVCNGEMKTLRFKCQSSSALAELEGLQAALELSIPYLMLGYRVEVRNDNRGCVESFTMAIKGLPSNAPICRKMLDFVQEHGNVFHSKNLKVRWILGHHGFSLQEVSDWLTRNESLDNCDRFDYFETVKHFGEFIDE